MCIIGERFNFKGILWKNNLVEIMDCIFISCCFFGRIGVKSDMGFWRCVCIIVNLFEFFVNDIYLLKKLNKICIVFFLDVLYCFF